MSAKPEKKGRICVLCGCRLPPSENKCPQCGNVYHEEDSDWEWKIFPRKDDTDGEERDDIDSK